MVTRPLLSVLPAQVVAELVELGAHLVDPGGRGPCGGCACGGGTGVCGAVEGGTGPGYGVCGGCGCDRAVGV